MKGYIVKYSPPLDDYCTHDIRVYLDRKEAVRYAEKFNKVLSKAKEFYDSKVSKNKYGYPDITEDTSNVELVISHKWWLFKEIGEAWVEEIEIVEPVKKKGNTRWD